MTCEMANNITYLIGAGASFNALPVVSNWNERLREFIEYLEDEKTFIVIDKLPDGHEDKLLVGDIDDILLDIKEFFSEAEKHATIDTYAKKLSLRGEEGDIRKLKGLKHFLGCFFSFEQTKLKHSKDDISEDHGEGELNPKIYIGQSLQIDPRYDVFFATLLKSETKSIDERVNIISWNYDLQFELAYKDFYKKEDPHQVLNVFPSTYFKLAANLPPNPSPKIIKLNGTAGLFHDPMNRPNRASAFISKGYQSSHIDFRTPELKDLLILYAKHIKGRATSEEPLLHFAWEMEDERNTTSKPALEYSKTIMENTDVLVVIGYSFPNFNRSVDKLLLEQLKTDCKIYYQDCKEKVNSLIQRLNGLLPTEGKKFPPIVPYTDVDQFFIPYEL